MAAWTPPPRPHHCTADTDQEECDRGPMPFPALGSGVLMGSTGAGRGFSRCDHHHCGECREHQPRGASHGPSDQPRRDEDGVSEGHAARDFFGGSPNTSGRSS